MARRWYLVPLVLVLTVMGSWSLWARGQADTGTAGQQQKMTITPPTAKPTKFSEAPILAAKVKAGQLPPVEQRLPKEPAVAEMLGPVGKYGGTLQTFGTGPGGYNDFNEMTENGPKGLRFDWNGNIIPDIFVGWQFDPDQMHLTLTMRDGIKWSDGVPFNIDDIMFTINDMHTNPKVTTWGMGIGGMKPATKIDDRTVRLTWAAKNPNAVRQVAGPFSGIIGWYPAHYLKKWHITYNPDADKVAKEEGYDNWFQALYSHYWWDPLKDLKKPTFQPWILVQSDSSTKVLERNPYYFRVDPAGNQLPYIDKIVTGIVDKEVYNLKIVSGEADIGFMETTFDNYSLYKRSEGEGGYKLYTLPGDSASEVSIVSNWTNPDPYKRALTQNVKFMAAISEAINRDEINKVIYKGLGVPRQATIQPWYKWYKPEWGQTYEKYDPADANRLLDEVGLAKKDGEGYRLNADGTRFHWVIESGGAGAGVTQVLELCTEYWKAVGLQITFKLFEPALFSEREHQSLHDLKVRSTSVNNHFNVGHWAGLWGQWLDAAKQIRQGTRDLQKDFAGKMPGEEPPQWVKDYSALFDIRDTTAEDSKEYAAALTKIMDTQAQHLFLVGTVGLIPRLMTSKNYLKNIWTDLPTATGQWYGYTNQYAEQVWLDK